MKFLAFTAAGVLFASALSPAPAEAQRHGYNAGRHWNGGHGYRDRRHAGRHRWQPQRRWRGGRARTRVVCHWQRSYYGPVKRCVRVRR